MDRDPALMERMEVIEEKLQPIPGNVGFGKYALSKWRDLPLDYLQYLASEECRTNEENKAKARQEIRNHDLTPGQLRFF